MIGGLQGENGYLNNEYLKKKSKSVGRKYLEALRRISQACKMVAKFRSLRNWPSAWCDRLPMALTSSFQLRFVHHLKCWIADLPIFETTYSMHEMSSKNCSKIIQQWLSS